MDDDTKLEQLLVDGCLVVGPVLPLSKVRPETIDNIVSVFSIQLGREILLSPSNRSEFLIMLRHPSTGHQVEILTSDECIIKRANEQRRYQEEPIGTLIRARCAALGGRSSHQRVFHADRLVASLDSLWGWQFTLGDVVGTFEVVIRLESTDSSAAEEAIDKLEYLLDYLAVSQQVGFHIQHCSVTPIPRLELACSIGPEERMLSPVTSKEIGNIETALSSSTEALVAARGLNQAYVENCMPSRLSILWAAAEHVFGNRPKHLLAKEEIRCLLDAARGIESLKNDSDRLGKLKEALWDPDRLPIKNRNMRMAEAIAPAMGISVDDAYSKISEASKLRGEHLHNLSTNWKGIEDSEGFLQEALLHYLAQQKTSLKV